MYGAMHAAMRGAVRQVRAMPSRLVAAAARWQQQEVAAMVAAGLSPAEEPAPRESPQPPPIANTSGPAAGLAPPLLSEAEARSAASSVACGEDIDLPACPPHDASGLASPPPPPQVTLEHIYYARNMHIHHVSSSAGPARGHVYV
eukprot:scaffold48490_cov64-Phaeocystis_antarctica.AAC.2